MATPCPKDRYNGRDIERQEMFDSAPSIIQHRCGFCGDPATEKHEPCHNKDGPSISV